MSDFERRKQRELELKRERIRKLQEAKKKQEELLDQANLALDEGKKLVDAKNFTEAKPHYEEAIEIFTKLGWTQQVETLQSELKNIDIYEEELKEKRKQEFLARKKKEKDFEDRAAGILAEKKKKEQERLARMRALPPQLQRNLQTAKMALEKAEKELGLKKFNRALGRFQYVIELYNTIPKEKMDISQDIKDIESKIEDLKSQM
jgi:DNA repair exonuclease SbcCD ATPase subunit